MPYDLLTGLRVLDLSATIAAAYCGRLLADAGATVRVADRAIETDPKNEAFEDYLAAGKLAIDKIALRTASPEQLNEALNDYDLVISRDRSPCHRDQTGRDAYGAIHSRQ